MDRTQKAETVEALQASLEGMSLVVVAHNLGLNAADVTDLRRRMRGSSITFQVTKNRLARIALKGTQFEGIEKLLTGPTTLAFSRDPVAAAKVASEFAKANDKFVVLGGGLGTQLLDAKGVDALAKLPSLDELRGRLVGLLNAPATKIAGIVQAPASQLARVLNAYATKSDAA